MDKDKKIRLLVLILVMGFSLAVFYHYIQGYYNGKLYPQNTFLFDPAYRHWDFLLPVSASADLNPFAPDKSWYYGGYLPFGQLIAYLFSLIKPIELSLCIFIGSFFIFLILMVKHYLFGLKSKLTSRQILTIFVLVFLTYPVLFAVDRSNFDMLICIFLFLFALSYEKQKWGLSTLFLAITIAIKPITGIFAIIYLIKKQYKQAMLLIFNFLILNIFSLSMFKDGLFAETQKFITSIIPSANALTEGLAFHFSSSLYHLSVVITKFLTPLFLVNMDLLYSDKFRILYVLFALMILILLLIYLWKKPQPFWKFMAITTIVLILLPFSSNDYRLIYLFIPLLMYLRDNCQTRHDLSFIILFGLLLVPKNYLAFNIAPQFYNWVDDQNIGMIINPMILIGLLVLLTWDQPLKRLFEVSTYNQVLYQLFSRKSA